MPSLPELVHSSGCNGAIIKCTLIRSFLKSIFSLVFFITFTCSTSDSAALAQWLPKGPKKMCVGLGTFTRSFLGEPGKEAGLVQLCGGVQTHPFWDLCVMLAISLWWNESQSSSKTQRVGLGLVMQWLPKWDLVVLGKEKTIFSSSNFTLLLPRSPL